jgi:hypothetical protein
MTSTDILNNSNRNMQNYSGVSKTLDMFARPQNTNNNINSDTTVLNEAKLATVSQSKEQVLLNTEGNSKNKVVTSYSKKSIAKDRMRNLSNAEAKTNEVTQENSIKEDATRTTSNTNTSRPTNTTNGNHSSDEVPKDAEGAKDSTKSKESELKAKQNELTDAEKKIVEQMKKRDNEVRIHENQHKSVGGQYAGSPSYTYERGPDGKQYITEGEVSISLSNESTAEKTIEKMRIVQNAALAPAEPSAADRKVAAEASRIEQIARQEINNQKLEESKELLEENSKSSEESKVESTEENARSEESKAISNASNVQVANESNNVANEMSKAGITVKNANNVNDIKQPSNESQNTITKTNQNIAKPKDDFVINTNNKYTATYLSYSNDLNKIDNRNSLFIAA